MTPDRLDELMNWGASWRVERLVRGEHEGRGWTLREYNDAGRLTGRLIYWHTGGSHHGPDPYWRVASPATGRFDLAR